MGKKGRRKARSGGAPSSSSSSAARARARGKRGSRDPPGAEELVRMADEAMGSAGGGGPSDAGAALALYRAAADALRSSIHGDGGNEDGGDRGKKKGDGCDDDGGDGEWGRVLLLARVLGRSGEARASLGDADGGRADFAEGIALLEPRAGGVEAGGAVITIGDDAAGDDDGGHGHGRDRCVDVSACSSSAAAGAAVMELDDRRPRDDDDDDEQVHDVLAGLHLYLGQLSAGMEALDSYRRGIRHLTLSVEKLRRRRDRGGDKSPADGATSSEAAAVADADDSVDALAAATRQLCGAHCSVAELYLTDLCYEPDAERRCEEALGLALEYDSDESPDARQALANLRLSQRRFREAGDAMGEAWERMRVGCTALANLVGLGPQGGGEGGEGGEERSRELVDEGEVASLPGFEFRCQSAKILLECAAHCKSNDGNGDGDNEDEDEDAKTGTVEERNRLAEAALCVMGSLLAEDDEVIELWYLVGCAFMAFSPPNPDMARHHWERALEMLLRVKEDLEGEMSGSSSAGGDDGDEAGDQLEEIRGQIADVESKLQEANVSNMDES